MEALEATLGCWPVVRRIARVDALILERVSRARFVFPFVCIGRACRAWSFPHMQH